MTLPAIALKNGTYVIGEGDLTVRGVQRHQSDERNNDIQDQAGQAAPLYKNSHHTTWRQAIANVSNMVPVRRIVSASEITVPENQNECSKRN
jgi:hypothetical protein